MTPEEKFNQEVWFVLNKIKKYSLYGRDGQDVEYRVYSPPDLSAEGMPFPVEEMKVIEKLAELGAIKIKPPGDRPETAEIGLSGAMQKFIVIEYLEILQPKFNELYRLYCQKIKEIKEDVEKRLKRINKEVVGQLEELTERQEEKESWEKEVIEKVQGNKKVSNDEGVKGLPKVFYDAVAGIGYVNGKQFKFKDDQPEYKIFGKLYHQIGKKLPRSEVLKIMGVKNQEPFFQAPKEVEFRKKKDTDTTTTYIINELVKKIRKRAGLTPEWLVNNNGNLTLRGQKIKKTS